MKQWTYGEVRTRVINEMDLQNETFVSADEMVGFCNEAMTEAESEIHKINEDYLLASAVITLVNGTQTYALPAAIFANKIRSVIYANGAIIYPVRRLRGEQKFYDATVTDYFGSAQYYRYRYFLLNQSSSAGIQMQLHPPAVESGALITVWFLRAVNLVPLVTAGSQAASDATVLDIPEFYNFILHYMKCKVMAKEGDPRLEEGMMALANQRKMMVDTLTVMVPDDDDVIIPDFSHYWEHE